MPTALILGASRGLGLALAQEFVARGWDVVATARASSGTKLHDLANAQLSIETLELTDPASLAALRARLKDSRIDLLFVNAGVSNGQGDRVAAASTDEFNRIMVTNALSPMRAIDALQHLVPPTGTIGVMSSSLGSVALNTRGGWETYRASKAALNTMMRSFAATHADDARTLIVADPGWVRTDMGGPGASLGVEDSIPRLVDTITGQSGKPGLQYLNYKGDTLPW